MNLTGTIKIDAYPAVTQLGYCNEPETDRELEIEIMIFDRPVMIQDKPFYSIVRTTYTDTKVVHGIELYQVILSEAQCNEAIKTISANPNNFKQNAKPKN